MVGYYLTNGYRYDILIKMEIQIQYLKCKRCSAKWVPRKADIRTCPKCRSPYWDREKK